MIYNLIKDIPGVCKGTNITKVDINPANPIGFTFTRDGELILWLRQNSDLVDLIKEGWIRESYAKEFFIALNDDYDVVFCGRLNPQDAFKNVIKVREIIE